MTTVIKSIDLLKNEIEKTRQNLHQTDLTIKRITGRDDPSRQFPGKGNFEVIRRGTVASHIRPDAEPGAKRRYSGAISEFRGRDTQRESGEEDDDDNVNISLASAVVATNKEVKSREEAIQEQSKDKEGTARNRRMFSLLMGTLNQFREDEKKKEKQEKKRKEVEKKLEEKQREETEKMRKEKHQLFQSKRQQQFKLRQLEVKMEVVQLHEEWEEQSKQLMHFIRTDTKPHIYYLPKVHNDITLKKLEQSKKLIEAVVSKRRGMLDEEINSILMAEEECFHDENDNYNKDGNEPPQKKIKTDKENSGFQTSRNTKGNNKISLDQGDQDDSDLEFNRHESIGFDYQMEGSEQEKNNLTYNFQQESELSRGDLSDSMLNNNSQSNFQDSQKVGHLQIQSVVEGLQDVHDTQDIFLEHQVDEIIGVKQDKVDG